MRRVLPLILPFVPGALAFAQTKLSNPSPGGGATLMEFIDLLINIVQAVGIPALVVAIIYAGYKLVTAGDNEKQITDAKIWIATSLIGAAIVLSAHQIAHVVCETANSFDSSISCV